MKKVTGSLHVVKPDIQVGKKIKVIDKYINKVIECINEGICPTCWNKPLGRLCESCLYFDGVSLKEIVIRKGN